MFDELREMNELISRKQERIDELRSALTSIGISYSSDRVQTSLHDKMSDMMCKIIVMENELDAMIDDFSDMKSRAKRIIFTLSNEEWQDIIYTHYVEFKTFREIAEKKGVSVNSVLLKNNRALKVLKKHLDETRSL